MRTSRGARLPILVVACLVPGWSLPSALSGAATTRHQTSASGELFREASADSGLSFLHQGQRADSLLLPEITGSGLALLDYDRDGDLDLFFVQSGDLDPQRNRESGSGDALFRNEGERGGALRFTDVTSEAGLASWGFGMGVAAGDYDNDGWTDLYVANLGSNALLRNDGGSFREVTAAAGADDPRWSVAATFADFDGDGWLDLYVANYLTWSADDPAECFAPSTRRDYCGPSAYPPAADRLLRNRGDGTFEPVAAGSLEAAPAPGLGVVAADFDGDGKLDALVANDGAANQLWLQRDGRSFVDEALLAGLALNRSGSPEASMGIALTDRDHDGAPDVLFTHLSAETNTLYRGRAGGLYEDVTVLSALGPPSLPLTAFGVDWLDVNGDGTLDLVVANGAVRLHDARNGLGQPNQLFVGSPEGRYRDVSASMPPSFLAPETSRGLAVGDLDNDGDSDFVISNNSSQPRVYLQTGTPTKTLGLRLMTAADETARDAQGATLTLRFGTGAQRTGRAHTDGSYASARDPRVLLSLPEDLRVEDARELTIVWPDGRSDRRPWESLENRNVDGGFRYVVVTPLEGER